MRMRKVQLLSKTFLLILVAALVSSCASTVTYRDIQKDFNNAVQADNLKTVEGIGAITSSSLVGYEDVLDRLKDEYIQSVDTKLKFNAYTMKAVAQWRTGKLSEAKQTAASALALGNVPSSPRDKMVLLIIRPLVNDQDLEARYRQLPAPRRVSLADYQNIYAKDFADAAAGLKDAATLAPPDLPEDMVFYVHYQRWRVLQNWYIVLISLWDGKDAFSDASIKIQDQARADAKKALNGMELKEEVKNQKEKIPEGHWLRRYIEFKEKQ
ncbi:MAG: hypothetical protein ACYDIC_17370 [Desulfobaccales bacterium]